MAIDHWPLINGHGSMAIDQWPLINWPLINWQITKPHGGWEGVKGLWRRKNKISAGRGKEEGISFRDRLGISLGQSLNSFAVVLGSIWNHFGISLG